MLYGVGVGPGDPELLTIKAARLLSEADIVAVPDKGGGEKTAMNIVREHIEGKELLYCETLMTRDREILERGYDKIADDVAEKLNAGKMVVFITLGDPTVYSTYVYVHKRILERGYAAQIVPGVTSFCAVAARLNIPLCEGSERLLVVPASHDSADTLDFPANKVYMKAGSGIMELKEQLLERGKQASMVENCGMDDERVYESLDELTEPSGYFSVVIVKDS